MELDHYTSYAMVHLNDESTYEKLTEEEATSEGQRLFREMRRWTLTSRVRGTITGDKAKYIRKHTSGKGGRPTWILLPTV